MKKSDSSDSPDLLSVAQSAESLGVTRQRVHDLIKNNQIIARKLGRYYYIETIEVERYRNQPTSHSARRLRDGQGLHQGFIDGSITYKSNFLKVVLSESKLSQSIYCDRLQRLVTRLLFAQFDLRLRHLATR